ncbi:MAG: hypothetical protein QOD80_1511 [Verrucomicrobiota bacterium]|jgi:hypothetical protein
MPAVSTADQSKKARASGKAAAATGGTVFVLLADCLPEQSPWKKWILAAAPTLTVCLSAFSSWGIAEAHAYWQKRKNDKALYKVKKVTQDFLKTEGTSEEHKAFIRAKLEEIEKFEIDNQVKSIVGQNMELPPEKNIEQVVVAKRAPDQSTKTGGRKLSNVQKDTS